MGSRYWSLGSPQAGTEENNQVGRLQCISPSAENGLPIGVTQTVLKDSHGIGVQATRHGHAEHYGVIPGIKISVSNSRHHANRFQVLGY
uniref:Uncharacterized protein n=1 Tax=Oryza meridionalis TaxID=40149 RepID=A0A0E0EKN8_9ORYZ